MWDFETDADAISWETAESPFSGTFHDVVASAGGPCAVGEGGVVAGRGPDDWGIVLDDGPAGRAETLKAVDATDDGRRIWFAGANGALGYYDHGRSAHSDFSRPRELETAIRTLAVAGERGGEKLLVADDSLTVLAGEVAGGSIEWKPEPAPDAPPTALTADADGVGYAVDANGHAWRTTADEEWEQLGVEPAGGSLHGVCLVGSVWVGGDNGRVFQRANGTWTPFTLGDFAVRTLDGHRGRLLAGGENGRLFAKPNGKDWRAVETKTHATLHGVLAGAGVAVGANGTILEAPAK